MLCLRIIYSNLYKYFLKVMDRLFLVEDQGCWIAYLEYLENYLEKEKMNTTQNNIVF